MQDTAGEVGTRSLLMYSNGPLHMAEQKQSDLFDPTSSSSVRIRDVALWTCRKRWMKRRDGERRSEISMLMARQHYYYYYLLKVHISLSTFFQFYSVVSQDSKVVNSADFLLFFLLIIKRPGLLVEIRWSVSMSKSLRSLCVSFSRTGAGLCIYHLLARSNLTVLHISQWITLSSLVLLLSQFAASTYYVIDIFISATT